MPFLNAVWIEPDHIDISKRWPWLAIVEGIPDRIPDKPGRDPAIWQTEICHQSQKMPADGVAAQDRTYLQVVSFAHIAG